MLLKNKKILISAGIVAILAAPSAVVIWWATSNRSGPVDVENINNESDVNIVSEQIREWNSGTKTINKNTMIARFLPHHIDDKVLNNHYEHVVEAISSEKNVSLIPLVETNRQFKMDYDFYQSPNKILIPDYGKLRRGTDINLSILQNEHDSEQGQIALGIQVSKGENNRQVKRQVVIHMKGFHTQSERYENDVIFAKNAIFRKLNTDPNDDWTETPPPQDNYDFELTINSDLPKSLQTPEQIRMEYQEKHLNDDDLVLFGLYPPEGKETNHYHNNHRVHNAKVIYQIIPNGNEHDGKLVIKAVISKKNLSDTLLIPIHGFLTKDQSDEKDVNDVWGQIKTPQQTSLQGQYPSWDIGEKLQAANLGIEDFATNDITITYQIVDIDSNEGFVKAKAIVQKGNIIKEKDIVITGFRTEKHLRIDDVLNKLQNQKTWHTNLLPIWQENEKVTPSDLGIPALTDEEKNDVKLTYIIKSVNQERGEVDVEVIGEYTPYKNSTIITVSGYKTLDESVTEKIRNYFEFKYKNIKLRSNSPWTKRLASQAQSRFTSELINEELKELNIQPLNESITNGASLTYRLVASDDIKGEITIEVTIKKGLSTVQATFKVFGFEKEEVHNAKIVEEIYQKIINDNAISETNQIVHLKNNSPYIPKLPSKCKLYLQEDLENTQLTNLNIVIGNFEKAQISAKVWKINDEDGSVEVIVTINLKDAHKDLLITVHGFKNKNEQDKIDVAGLKTYLEDLHKDVHINQKSADKLKLPSEIKSEYQNGNLSIDDLKRFNIPIIDDRQLGEAKVNYKIIDFNNGSGQVTINMTITQNKVTDNFKFYVKGFQTQNDRYKQQIKEILIKFDNDNQNKVIRPETGWNEKRVSELGFANNQLITRTIAKKLGIIWDDSDLELEWEFRVDKIDDEKGILIVKIILSKNLLSDATTLQIIGFKKSTSN